MVLVTSFNFDALLSLRKYIRMYNISSRYVCVYM